MVDKKLLNVIRGHQVITNTISSNGMTDVLELHDSTDTLTVRIVYVNQQIYSVQFLNNDFFDMKDDSKLYEVVGNILGGKYSIDRVGILKKQITIKTIVRGEEMYPERLYSDKEFKTLYKTLPRVW